MTAERLRQRAHARQVRAVALADRAANRVNEVVRRVWVQVLVALHLPPHDAAVEVMRLLRSLPHVARTSVADSLGHVVTWGRRSARAVVVAEAR